MKKFFCTPQQLWNNFWVCLNCLAKSSSAIVILLLTFFLSCAHADDLSMKSAFAGSPLSGETSELWEGEIYTSTYRVGVCFSATGRVRGALFLRRADAQIDEYHFSGTIYNNHLEVRHSSGHEFVGRLATSDKVEGRITLKNGMRFFLEGKRIQDAPLNYEDCSPLPESNK